MNTNDLITIVFSSTVIATIITTIFNLFKSRKENSLENITKERKAWRDELRTIALIIQKSKNQEELNIAICQLKVRINAYGQTRYWIFQDAYIWELIYVVESKKIISHEELKTIKHQFVDLISCMLKYDWDRSKAEIKGSTHTRIVVVTLTISFLLYSARLFFNYDTSVNDYISFCTFYFIFIAYSLIVINFADKWYYKKQLITFLTIAISLFILIIEGMILIDPMIFPSEPIDILILCAPMVALIYCAELKYLTYRLNMKSFILSSTLSAGKNSISIRYRIFFNKYFQKNLYRDKDITFYEDDEPVCLLDSIKDSLYDKSNIE